MSIVPRTPHYAVQVLLPAQPAIDPTAVHAELAGSRSDAQLICPGPTQFGVAIPTDDLPLLAHVFQAAPDAYAAQLDEALKWSRTWPERYTAITQCRASLVVSMIAHRAVDRQTMLVAFLAVLDAVLASLDDRRTCVLHWMPAQRVMSFATYRSLRLELGPCGPAIHVRIADVDLDTVADTIGLADLGLPDLQTLATGHDPAALTFRLVRLARRMFAGEKLDCVWVEEPAFQPPARDARTLQLD